MPSVIGPDAAHQPEFLWNPTQTELITTKFMRNRVLFSALVQDWLPRLRKQKGGPLRLLFWACSTGCEPYTMKFLLGPDSTDEIIGIDQDKDAIRQARLGVYHPDSWTMFFDEQKTLLDQGEVARWFEPAAAGSLKSFSVAQAYRRNISFLTGDLFSAKPSVPLRSFDLVVCNNLLLHLKPYSASQAWDYLYQYLNDDGLLLIGGCNPAVRLASAKRLNLSPCPEKLTEISKNWSGVSGAWSLNPRPAWAYPEPDENDPDYPFLVGEIFSKQAVGSLKNTPDPKPSTALCPKNILISGTNLWNPGDDFVREGVIRILREVFPDEGLNFLFYNFNPDVYPHEALFARSNILIHGDLEKYRDSVDAVVVVGVSAGYELKPLYRWVLANGLADKVYLISGHYESGYCADHIGEEPEATIFRKARIVIGRTNKYPDFIRASGIPYHRVNCPAILSVPEVKTVPPGKKIQRIGFSIQLPSTLGGLVNQLCATEPYQLAIAVLNDFARQYQVEVVAHHKTEYFHFLKLLQGTGIPVIFSSFYHHLCETYRRYDLVITTRLHTSLYANGHGTPGIIINDTDRHTHALEGFPHSPWVNTRAAFDHAFARWQQADLSVIAREADDFKSKLLARYVELLRPLLAGERPPITNSMEKQTAAADKPAGIMAGDKPNGVLATAQRILFVRTDSIGDAVLASAMLEPIRKKHPQAKLAVLCQQHVAELFAACPFVDSVICYDQKQMGLPSERAQIVSEIAAFQPDMILNSIRSRDQLSNELSLAFRDAHHVAIENDSENVSASGAAETAGTYELLIPSPGKLMAELERHAEFLRGLGIETSNLQPVIWTSPEDELLAAEFFKMQSLDPAKTIAVFPGAQHEVRVYSGYGDALKKLGEFHYLIFGDASQKHLAEQLEQQLPGRTVDLCGRTSLRETAALLRRCRLYVGAESAGAHIACAVGVPNVVILGGGHFGRFMPYSPLTTAVCLPMECYSCKWGCVHQRAHCIKDIAPEVLAEAVRQTLAAPSAEPRIFVPAESGEGTRGIARIRQLEAMIGAVPVKIIPVPTVAASAQTGNPEVSVIISTYNSERFMVACMEDVLAQTIQDKMEILVIDSGSEQNEAAIVAKYQQKHANIRYIRTEREPLYVAWNRAVKLARGKYVVNANTDDSRRPDAFEVLLAAMEKHADADLAYSYYGMTSKANDEFPPTSVYRNVRHDPYHPAQLLFYCITGCLQFWRKSSLESIGGFDERLKCVADYEILIRFMRQGMKPILIPEALSCFYINMQGISFGSSTAAKEDAAVKDRYQKAVSAAEVYDVDPANSREMAKAWINLGNFAAAVPIPWDDNPHRYYTYAIQCYQQAMKCDESCAAVWHNLAVISAHLGLADHFLKTFRNSKKDIVQIIATAKAKPTLTGFDLKPKVAGYVYRRERALSGPLAELGSRPKPSAQSTMASDTVVQRKISVNWEGSFLDFGSLSHVNRELTRALADSENVRLQCVNSPATKNDVTPKALKQFASTLAKKSPADPQITIRHAWPPNWQRPASGKLVVIQPWEFGSLPEEWVKDSANVDEFWVPSEYVRRVYVESGVPANKVVVVPNGVDLDKFHAQVAPMKLATQKKFKFLFVGGTIFRKGPDLLLKAFLDNFTAADDVCLVLKDFGGKTVYTGQTFESQIRAAQSQPNAPQILYLNEELPPDSLPGLYTACDCLVLPYRGEGFGLPVLEAMACGLPVIVTAGGATDDFVRDDFSWRISASRKIFGNEISGLKLTGAGWLLEPDVAALGRFLREVFANPAEALRRGQLAAQHARQFWTWQNSAAIAVQRIRELSRTDLPVGPDSPPRVAAAKTAPSLKIKITLPPCARVGQLAEARGLVRQKKFRAAWESALSALAKRPFHPEAGLLLAEIAQAVGDGQNAKLCAEQVRRIAPDWKPAKKFLAQRIKGGAKPDWLILTDALSSQLPTPNPKLSVCLIVKNEEKFLGQCLKSIREIAAQIVVVDTGSTDRTVEIAREFGAEVHSFAWCDDFSAARNAALEHATGDWVLMLDADEELSADGCEKLKQSMSDQAVLAWRLPIVDVGREADGCSYVPRFFRNAPGLFYVGRVHEQVFSSIEVRRAEWGLENRIGNATLIHHGYTAELTRDRNKVERNLLLLERAVEELPDEPHLLMNLGLELSRSGREAAALGRYLEAFNSLSSKPAAEIVPELRETLLMQLCARLTAAKQFEEVVRVLNSPLARMDGGLTASLHFSLGLSHLELRRFSEAADQMRQCLATRSQRSLAPITKEINTAAPHHCLALCLAKSGDTAAAEMAFEDGLKETGHGDALRLDYARFLAGQNRPVDALHRLNEVVAENKLHLGAWQLGGQIALSRPEFLEFARDWTGEAMRQVAEDPLILAQRAETLMLSEDSAGALELWEQVWNRGPQPAVLAALILCETLESPTTHAPAEEQGESAVSCAFIEWYRKLIAARAHKTVMRLNEQTDKLARALPGAARMLSAAMTEASRAGAAGA